MKHWYLNDFQLGALLGAVIASLMGLRWYYTIFIWPAVFFGLDWCWEQIEKKKLEKEKKT